MASLSGFFGVLAMLIARIGLYGVMSDRPSRPDPAASRSCGRRVWAPAADPTSAFGSQHRIEQHQHRLDAMLVRDAEELIDPAASEAVLDPAARASRAGIRASCSSRCPPPSRVRSRCGSGSNVSACHISSSLIALAGRSWRRPATAAPCTNRWPVARTSDLAPSMAPARVRARRRPEEEEHEEENYWKAADLPPSSKPLTAHDACALANDDELIRRRRSATCLRRAVRPADGQVRAGRRAEPEVQAAIVDRVEARLRGAPPAPACGRRSGR